ncbi:Zinc finger protein [Pseudolycoriella hygida]|uniref:Zinc finger protein n=1 Tax=Pseudolycoriella hygida TaxID=35572 RepID=A0A9Q0RWP7_9DIPT|nr:Zinc finger protein [Pseudolycoriella hygida]
MVRDRLREHLKIHSMRRYSCPHCSQYFSNTGGLRSHIGIHTGIRPYACGVCDMTFVNTSSASVHRRTHLVGNVFQCEKCLGEFKHYRSFTIHKEACFLSPDQLNNTN